MVRQAAPVEDGEGLCSKENRLLLQLVCQFLRENVRVNETYHKPYIVSYAGFIAMGDT